jgi:hypothetical protein
MKESMNKLNERRNSIKHKGITPGKIEIETSRVNTTEFFENITPILFDLNFADISLFDLIKYETTKLFLKSSQVNLDNSRIEPAIEDVTKAFHELLFEYKENKRGWGHDYKTHFKFIDKIKFDKKRNYNPKDRVVESVENNVESVIEKVNKNFEQIDTAIEVISLGLDYRKYTKFKILTPYSVRFPDGKYRLSIYGEKNWSIENCQFLIDFVLESAIKLQEFDYDFESLDITDTTVTLK